MQSMFLTQQQANSNTTSINNGCYIYNILFVLNLVHYLYRKGLTIVIPDRFDTGFVADIRGWEAVQCSRLPLDLCCHLEDRVRRLIPGVVWSGGCVFCFI